MTGRPHVLDSNLRLARLARRQAGVLTRRQLAECGIGHEAVDDHVRARRWREPVPGVVVLHCGPIIEGARAWLAVLAGGESAALCAWTALAGFGLEGWLRPATHVVVRRGRHVPTITGVVVHESRRHGPSDIWLRDGLPSHSVERAAIDAGAWAKTVRSACGLLAAVVQQGLTTPSRLLTALDGTGRVAHRKRMLHALADIEGGSRAMSEIDLVRLCRRAGLPEPVRQRVRRDVNGRRRYLDAEWDLGGGRTVSLEVDGIHHLDAGQWYDDLLRQSELVVPGGHRVIRIPALALRLEPERVLAILRRAIYAPAA
jgi:hypothetical protein